MAVRGEYGMKEATHGLAHLELQDQELKDLEVARMLQEEEIKESQFDRRVAQVAQDEVRHGSLFFCTVRGVATSR
uniref:Zinc finger CCCH domain-containing protein 13-like n=1 Tax=Sinocyclocheilus anshuiensis TaxID=1608454 RepID=A0A671N778_9TELE